MIASSCPPRRAARLVLATALAVLLRSPTGAADVTPPPASPVPGALELDRTVLAPVIVPDEHGRRFVDFVVRGNLILPAGVERADGCDGALILTVLSRHHRVTRTRALVGPRCRFSQRFHFRRTRAGRRLVLKLLFTGTNFVAPIEMRETLHVPRLP